MRCWSDVKEYACINGSLSQSVNKNSVMSFTAKSRQICLYGVKDAQYGKMDVYVDGKLYTTVDLFSETTMTDQLIFAIDFDYPMEHSIKVMPAGNDDVINIDYLAYIRVEEESIDQNMGVLYYVLIIPAAIIIALIGAAIADRVSNVCNTRGRYLSTRRVFLLYIVVVICIDLNVLGTGSFDFIIEKYDKSNNISKYLQKVVAIVLTFGNNVV